MTIFEGFLGETSEYLEESACDRPPAPGAENIPDLMHQQGLMHGPLTPRQQEYYDECYAVIGPSPKKDCLERVRLAEIICNGSRTIRLSDF